MRLQVAFVKKSQQVSVKKKKYNDDDCTSLELASNLLVQQCYGNIIMEQQQQQQDQKEQERFDVLETSDKDKEPILLLNGFGVGSFYQHRLIPRLLKKMTTGT